MLTYRLRKFARDKMPLALTLQKWKPGQESGKHIHDCVEIVYILKGSGVNIINGSPFPIIAGDLYIVNFGATHFLRADSEMALYNLMFHFSAFSKTERGLLAEIPQFRALFKLKGEEPEALPRKLFLPPPFAERLKNLFDSLYKETLKSEPGFRMRCKAYLILLINEICRAEPLLQRCKAEASSDNQRNSLSKVLGFINRSYVQPISLAEIAAAGNVSPKYISEFFKAKTGVRLVSYINALRIEKARQTLIERPELSIAEVAAACGFEEPSYFAKLFRRATGFTPKEHRNVSA